MTYGSLTTHPKFEPATSLAILDQSEARILTRQVAITSTCVHRPVIEVVLVGHKLYTSPPCKLARIENEILLTPFKHSEAFLAHIGPKEN